MKVNNGMLSPLDVARQNVPDGFYSYASNMIITQDGVDNEIGTTLNCIITPGFEQRGIIPFDNGYIRFSLNQSTGVGMIEKIVGSTCTCIVKSTAFNWSLTRPIAGVYSYNNNQQIVIVFWEGNAAGANPPRKLNVDCLPFEVDVDCNLINPDDIVLLDLTPKVNNIGLNAVVNQAGGSLKTGVYTIFFSYTGQYYYNTNPLSIIDDNNLVDVHQIDGAESGSNSSKAIQVNLTNLNTSFSSFKLLVVYNDGVTISTFETDEIAIQDTSAVYVITSLSNLATANLSNSLTPKLAFESVQAGSLIENDLYLANVNIAPIPDIQPYVNNITVKWDASERIDLCDANDSFKNPNVIALKRMFRSNEVYGLYLILNMDNGAKYAYHIPGRSAVSYNGITPTLENDTVQAYLDSGFASHNINQAIAVDPNGKLFQFFDTAKSNGIMGYWENQSEFYPDTDCFDIKDSDGNIIGTLRNQPVRHHKTPSLGSIQSWLGQMFTSTNAVTQQYLKIITAPGGYSGSNMIFTDSINNSGLETSLNTASNGTYSITFLKDKYIKLFLWYHLDDGGSNGVNPKFDNFEFKVTVNGAVMYEHIDVDVVTYGTEFFMYAPAGTKIELFIHDGNTSNPSSESRLDIFDINFNEEELLSRIIGLKLENVFIPDAIRDRVISYELGYAERTGSNITCIGQATVFPYKDIADDKLRTHPFDMLANMVSTSFSYVDTQFKWQGDFPHIYNPGTPLKELRAVEMAQYVPYGVTSPVDNTYGEEHLHIELDIPIGSAPLSPLVYQKGALSDFKIHLTDIYLGVFNQNIVSTGMRIDPATTNTGVIFGGDTFVSFYGVIMSRFKQASEWPDPWFGISDLRITYEVFAYPVESYSNLNFRHVTDNNWYVPKLLDFQGGLEALVGEDKTQTANGTSYNPAYTSVNNLLPITIKNCEDDCDEDTGRNPSNVYRSLSGSLESDFSNWSIFPSNQVYTMPLNKKEIWKLDTLGYSLIIHTRISLFFAMHKDTLTISEATIGLGDASIFDTKPREVFLESTGYFGCKDQFAAFVCKLGYVAVDRVTGIIALFDGSGIREFTVPELGFNNFMERYANLSSGIDDPYAGNGWSGCYDKLNNRLVFSKIAGNSDQKFTSFTISIYVTDSKTAFASFHSYISHRLFHNASGMFGVSNYVNAGVYKHNTGVPGLYYGSVNIKPSLIDIPLNVQTHGAVYNAIAWKSLRTNGDLVKIDKSFDVFVAYNNNQCSGEIALTHYTGRNPEKRSLRMIDGIFYFGNFSDIVADVSQPFMDSTFELITANINANMTWFRRRTFNLEFIVVRFIISNDLSDRIKLNDIELVNLRIVERNKK